RSSTGLDRSAVGGADGFGYAVVRVEVGQGQDLGGQLRRDLETYGQLPGGDRRVVLVVVLRSDLPAAGEQVRRDNREGELGTVRRGDRSVDGGRCQRGCRCRRPSRPGWAAAAGRRDG